MRIVRRKNAESNLDAIGEAARHMLAGDCVVIIEDDKGDTVATVCKCFNDNRLSMVIVYREGGRTSHYKNVQGIVYNGDIVAVVALLSGQLVQLDTN